MVTIKYFYKLNIFIQLLKSTMEFQAFDKLNFQFKEQNKSKKFFYEK